MSGEARGPAIGIDLGTTYSCVGFWRNDRVEILENDQGNRITPSYVSFTDAERLDGNAAHNQAIFNPVNTIFDAKRLIGRKFNDETVQNDMKLWPFKVINGPNDRPVIDVTYKGENKQFAAEEISSFVLTRMKQTAEDKIGTVVKDAVVTVPAYFDQSQRQATMDAAEIAGINILSIINEPTAAAIAYGLENSWTFDGMRNVIVFDLGGGTFDISILTMEKGKIQVKATGGDTHLGGEDFDNNVVNHFVDQFNRKNNRDIRENPKAIRKLRSACEKAKRILSSASSVVIEIDTLDGVDFYAKLTRAKFEELNHDLFKKCMDIMEECLKDAEMDKSSVHDVVLVGGSSRIPKIQDLLREFLNGKELCKSINPDEAVAYGAAVHAAKLSGQGNSRILDLELVEVTPLSIGIESRGMVMDIVFPRNTTIPATKTLVRTTVEDNQTSVTFKVFEGERARTADNKLLGEFTMTDIVKAPRGIPYLELRFDLELDGILKVSAKDRSSGREHSIVVSSGRLSRQQMEEMAEVARNYKSEDEMYRKKEEARVEFEKCVYEMRDKLGMMTVASVKGAIREALEWLDGMNDDLAEVHEFEHKTKELRLLRLFSSN